MMKIRPRIAYFRINGFGVLLRTGVFIGKFERLTKDIISDETNKKYPDIFKKDLP